MRIEDSLCVPAMINFDPTCTPRSRVLESLSSGSSRQIIFAECSSNECTVDICLVESIVHFVFVELSAKLELVEYSFKLSTLVKFLWFGMLKECGVVCILVTTALNLPL